MKVRIGKKVLVLGLLSFFSILLFKASVASSHHVARFNQTRTVNITGNASTIDQTTINSYLNVNGDGLTWDVTEAVVSNATPTYYINATETLQTQAGTTQREVLRLTWFAEAGSSYLVMGYLEGNNSVTTEQTVVRVFNSTHLLFYFADRPRVANTERMPFYFAMIQRGAGASVTYNWTIASSSTATAGAIRARLVAIRLDNLPNAHFNSSYVSVEAANVDNVWGNAVGDTDEIRITPSVDGLYLLIGVAKVESDSTTSSVSARMNINDGEEFIPYLIGAEATWSYARIEDTSTAEEHPFGIFALRWFNSSVTHSIKFQVADIDTTFSADWQYRSLMAIRLTGVFKFFNASTRTQASTTSLTFVNYTTISIPAGNAGSYIAIGGITTRGSSTAVDFETRLTLDGAANTLKRIRPQDLNDYVPNIFMHNFSIDSSPHYLATQYRTVAAGTVWAKNSDVLALSLEGIIDYQVSVEHNATISYSGVLNSINVSINFTSTVADVYNMTIYNFTGLRWEAGGCQNLSAIAGTYYTIWCNVTINPTNFISPTGVVRVRLNSTPDADRGTLREEYVQFYTAYTVGYIEVRLVQPSPAITTNVIQNSTFTVNATVFCRGAPCGYVNGTVMYNLTSPYPDTAINTTFGDKPFFVQETPALAMKSCPNNPLNANDFCNLTWRVNATGDTGTGWKIGVYFNSSYPQVQPNATANATLSIIPCTVDFSLTWSSISFGLLTPSTYNNSAPGNQNNQYNITVNPGSCNLDLYIRGTDLTNATLNSIIKVGNVSWSNISSNINDGYFRLTGTNSIIRSNVPAVTGITTWYWLNVPPVYAGYYNGTISIKGVVHGEAP